MRKLVLAMFAFMCLFLCQPQVSYADGGSAGLVPGTGFKVRFGDGNHDFMIPIRARFEWRVDDEEKHAVGTDFGGSIGTNFTPNFISISPFYHYYLKGDAEGFYVGGNLSFDVKSNVNMIGIGAVAGYKHDFGESECFSIFGEGCVGFNTMNWNGYRSNGGQFAIYAGALVNFGNKE